MERCRGMIYFQSEIVFGCPCVRAPRMSIDLMIGTAASYSVSHIATTEPQKKKNRRGWDAGEWTSGWENEESFVLLVDCEMFTTEQGYAVSRPRSLVGPFSKVSTAQNKEVENKSNMCADVAMGMPLSVDEYL